jgi:hypothetical protein
MRTLGYLLLSVGEAVGDGVVWVWNHFSRNAPIIERDNWTDGT